MTALAKPITRKVNAAVPHGVNDQLAVTVYPSAISAVIGLREARRRKASELCIDVADLYMILLRRKCAQVAAEKRAKRKARKGARGKS